MKKKRGISWLKNKRSHGETHTYTHAHVYNFLKNHFFKIRHI